MLGGVGKKKKKKEKKKERRKEEKSHHTKGEAESFFQSEETLVGVK